MEYAWCTGTFAEIEKGICEVMENHYISIENRSRVTITQVEDVDAFDEQTLWANLKEGGIEIRGEKLNIERLDLQLGELVVSGKICMLAYNDKGVKRHGFLGFGRKEKK